MRLVDLISRQDARHRLGGIGRRCGGFLCREGASSDLECGDCRLECSRCRYPWAGLAYNSDETAAQNTSISAATRSQPLPGFLFVVVAASAALFAVGFLVSVKRSQTDPHFIIHLLLVLMTVIFSWTLVHTVYALRYAHAFYGDSDEPGVNQHAGGLIFPGDHPPDYFDFAYFSFVVGMTRQVSDVQITSRRMRRIALFHSVLSFGFNTIILALLINIAVSGLS